MWKAETATAKVRLKKGTKIGSSGGKEVEVRINTLNRSVKHSHGSKGHPMLKKLPPMALSQATKRKYYEFH